MRYQTVIIVFFFHVLCLWSSVIGRYEEARKLRKNDDILLNNHENVANFVSDEPSTQLDLNHLQEFVAKRSLSFNKTHTLTLSPVEVNILRVLAANITAHPSNEAVLFCEQAAEMAEFLPVRIRNVLTEFANEGSSTGMLLITRIPLDDETLPVTPPGNQVHSGELTIMARIQAIFNHAYGHMIGYEAEGDGRLFQDMVPKEELKSSQTSLGSNVELEIHTEQAFSKLRPDIVSLACLRGDPDAKTYILPVHYLLEYVTPQQQEFLRQSYWTTGVDMSFKMNGHEFLDGDLRGPLPIISGSYDDPYFVFDQDLMKGVRNDAQEMIQKIVDVYYVHRLEHVLSPGEIVLVDNRRAVHGRSPFKPKFDGTDRFIIRSFAVLDYEKSSYARPDGGKTVAARFS
jgi:L-asparagine oxygenase